VHVCVELQESREIVNWSQTVFYYAASSIHGKTLKHCVSRTLDAPTLLLNCSSESMYVRHLNSCTVIAPAFSPRLISWNL